MIFSKKFLGRVILNIAVFVVKNIANLAGMLLKVLYLETFVYLFIEN